MTPLTFHSHRRAHGSQRKVAAQLGIGFRTLQRIEGGKLGDPIPNKYERLILSLLDEANPHVSGKKGI